MEQQLHKSFIPKQSLARPRTVGGGGGFLIFISAAILIISILGWLGAHAYVAHLENTVRDLQQDIAEAKISLEPATLTTFQILDSRLTMAEQLLDNHITLTPLFKTIEQLTVQGVRYNNFSFQNRETTMDVKMSGQARQLSLVALQAAAFGDEPRILNPIFSNLQLDPAGQVNFDVTFSVDHELLSFIGASTF